MARSKPIFVGDAVVQPMTDQRSWARSHGTYIAGRAYIDGADKAASDMEAKWGCGRLRLLVGAELREKFDRQRYLFNQAIWHGELEDVRREAGRMVNAWRALDRAAEAAGAKKLSPMVWEIAVEEKSTSDSPEAFVAAIVPDAEHAHQVVGEGRRVAVYTLDEIGRLLSSYREIARTKVVFPGATVIKISRSVEDPLNAVSDTSGALDDELPF